MLDSISGEEWDALPISANVPAGSTSLTVQAFSRDDFGTNLLPASFDWLVAAFALEPDKVPTTPLPGRMTGGGSVFTIAGARVTHGFQIHCDLRPPNNLQVNWPGGNRFHLTTLTSAVCIDTSVDQNPPAAPFDTFTGTGIGRYNGQRGARIEFIFVDAGEPGVLDTASIKVFDADDNLVLDVAGFLNRGNHQAHKDQQSTIP